MNLITHKKIIVVATLSQNGVYGEGNTTPWHLPADLEHSKELTRDGTVVTGRRTQESLPTKFCPLSNRYNTVITTNQNYTASGAIVVSTLKQAISEAPTEKVFCIGGYRVWMEAIEIADDAWITKVYKDYPITRGVTHTATDLLTPHYLRGDFYCKEIKRPVERWSSDPYFEIFHWTK
jgi:dihydrofolate reductase